MAKKQNSAAKNVILWIHIKNQMPKGRVTSVTLSDSLLPLHFLTLMAALVRGTSESRCDSRDWKRRGK